MTTPEVLTHLEEKLRPEHTALVIVDVQNDYCDDEGCFGRLGVDISAIQAMVPRLEALLEDARRAGVWTVFVQAIYDEVYLSGPMRDRMARASYTEPHCITDSWGAEFYRIRPQPGEPVVVKHRYSAFHGTELDNLLRCRGIKTLLTVGVTTDVCVAATARDGYMRDYYIVYPEDCMAARTEALHQAALENITRYHGVVTTAEEIRETWTRVGVLEPGHARP